MAAHPLPDLPPVPLAAERPTLSIPEAGAYLGLRYVASYEAANKGYLPTIQTSAKRRVVPTAALRRLLLIDPPVESDGAA
jgi:hypothetical protein